MFYSRQSYLSCFFLFLIIFFGICSFSIFGNVKKPIEKTIIFSELTLPPASGNKPDSVVVLFHGYGDVGENFLFLSAFWAELLPSTLFVALDGPMSCNDIPGKKWLRASSKNRASLIKEIDLLALSLNRYLDGLLKKYGISPEKMALVGFSQGARVALHVGLRYPCAGIVAFSGSFLDGSTSKLRLPAPPILLIHGVDDLKAPSSLARESYKCLEALRVPVTLFLIPGLGHDIDPRGSGIAGEFLKDCLSGKLKEF